MKPSQHRGLLGSAQRIPRSIYQQAIPQENLQRVQWALMSVEVTSRINCLRRSLKPFLSRSLNLAASVIFARLSLKRTSRLTHSPSHASPKSWLPSSAISRLGSQPCHTVLYLRSLVPPLVYFSNLSPSHLTNVTSKTTSFLTSEKT